MPSGFTLMELLVALALFAITTGLITDLFMSASRHHAQATALTVLQEDARRITETVTRELRDGAMDYERLSAGAVAVRDAEGNTRTTMRVTDGCPSHGASCVVLTVRSGTTGAEETAPMTSAGTSVEEFVVRVAPESDPFAWDVALARYAADEQPRATIAFRISRAARGRDVVTLEAQTTIASRVYRR